ncbi:unnamed protein product, partial [Brassica napus]
MFLCYLVFENASLCCVSKGAFVFISLVFSRPCACTRLLFYIVVVAPLYYHPSFYQKPLF